MFQLGLYHQKYYLVIQFILLIESLYNFGILKLNVHMMVRSVCGRLKSDYRYSKNIVYNNFHGAILQ